MFAFHSSMCYTYIEIYVRDVSDMRSSEENQMKIVEYDIDYVK